MRRALDEYFEQGFDVESASDGWVLLRRRAERLALTCTPVPIGIHQAGPGFNTRGFGRFSLVPNPLV
ncbi:hypothetical protein [Actinokineospora spheciospongiae]|uniref:hypothetical protein n=1 Tax=Actinokineospora spheciospongiae TaxID=909613 RepID=UPI0011B46B32|nr:hypothetical protein [Actinokineospora spheciospongiae]